MPDTSPSDSISALASASNSAGEQDGLSKRSPATPADASGLFTVTNTDATGVGSFAWALEQANAYTGEGIPRIVFDASLAGAAIGDGYAQSLTVYRDMQLGSSDGVPVLLTALNFVENGACLQVDSGVMLGGNLSVDNGRLELAQGSILRASVSLGSTYYDTLGSLSLNGVRVEQSIGLYSGSLVEGSGNTFVSAKPFEIQSGPLDLAAALAGLEQSTYEAEKPRVAIGYIWTDIALEALPEGFDAYWVSAYAMSGAGQVTVAEGVELHVGVMSPMSPSAVGGSWLFEGNNTIRFYDEFSGAPIEDGVISFAGRYDGGESTVSLGNCRIEGTVALSDGVSLVCDGAFFGAQRALAVALSDWDGRTRPACMEGGLNSTCVPGGYVAYDINGLGGSALRWDGAAVQELLTPAGFASAEVERLVLAEGDHVTFGTGQEWASGPIILRSGATLSCEEGCSIVFDSRPLYDEEEEEPLAALVIEDGGLLEADGLSISGVLAVAPTARIEGSLHFEEGSRISLINWSGSAQQLLDTVLAGADWTSDGPLAIEIAAPPSLGDSNGNFHYEGFVGDSQLVSLGEGFSSYLVPSNFGYVGDSVQLRFGLGVELLVESYVNASHLTFEGDNVVRAPEGGSAWLNLPNAMDEGEIIMEAHGTRFELTVCLPSQGQVVGENVTFAAEVPVVIELQEEWDGTAAALQAAIDSTLSGIEGYEISAANPLLGLSFNSSWGGSGFAGDVILNEESLAAMVPEGFAGLHFNHLTLSNGHSLTVQAGTTLDVDSLYISNGDLIFEAGSAIADSVELVPEINLFDQQQGWDDAEPSRLVMNGLDLKGACIFRYGRHRVELIGCRGAAELNFSASGGGSVTISGCDLSQMRISLFGGEAAGDEGGMLDLSGNYWGTTDIEEIKAMIAGYDESRVILGDILTAPPMGGEVLGPVATVTSTEATGPGSFAWALAQALAYEGEEMPTVLFDESLAGLPLSAPAEPCRVTRALTLRAAAAPVTLTAPLCVEPGAMLTVGAGVSITDADCLGSMLFESGSALAGTLSVASGGSLRMEGITVSGRLALAEEARIEGEGNVFTGSGEVLRLESSGVSLEAFRGTATAENACIGLGYDTVAGITRYDVIGQGLDTYVLSNTLTVSDGATLSLGEGVTLRSDDCNCDLVIASGGSLVANGARLELLAHSTSTGGNLSCLTVETGGRAELTDTYIKGFYSESFSSSAAYSNLQVNSGASISMLRCVTDDIQNFRAENGSTVIAQDSDIWRLQSYGAVVLNGCTIGNTLRLGTGATVEGSGNSFCLTGAVIYIEDPTVDMRKFHADAQVAGAYAALASGSVTHDAYYTRLGEGMDTYVIGGRVTVQSGATASLGVGARLTSTARGLRIMDGGRFEANGALIQFTGGSRNPVTVLYVESGGDVQLRDTRFVGADIGVSTLVNKQSIYLASAASLTMNGCTLENVVNFLAEADTQLSIEDSTLQNLICGGDLSLYGSTFSGVLTLPEGAEARGLGNTFTGTGAVIRLQDVMVNLYGLSAVATSAGAYVAVAGGSVEYLQMATFSKLGADSLVDNAFAIDTYELEDEITVESSALNLREVTLRCPGFGVVVGRHGSMEATDSRLEFTGGAGLDVCDGGELRLSGSTLVGEGSNPIRLAEGAVLRMLNCTLEQIPQLDAGRGTLVEISGTTLPGLSIAGSLLLNGCTVEGQLLLAEGGSVSGSGSVFTGRGDVIYLMEPSCNLGSFAATATDEGATIGVAAGLIAGTVSFAKLGEGLDAYRLDGALRVKEYSTFRVGEGVTLLGGSLSVSNSAQMHATKARLELNGTLNLLGGSVAVLADTVVTGGGVVGEAGSRLEAAGSTFGNIRSDGRVELGESTVSGQIALGAAGRLVGNAHFTGAGDVIYLESLLTDVSGFTATLEQPEAATIGLAGGTLTSAVTLHAVGELNTYRLGGTLRLQDGGILRLGSDVCLRSESYGCDVVVGSGGKFISHGSRLELLGHASASGGDLSGLIVRSGGQALLTDTTIVGYKASPAAFNENNCTVYVKAGGDITLTGCNLVDVTMFHVEQGSRLQLENCDIGDLVIAGGGGVVISNCNFVGRLWYAYNNIVTTTPPPVSSGVIWVPPVIINTPTAPLTLFEPVKKALGTDSTEVTFVWGVHGIENETASYVLTVNGRKIHLDATTTYTMVLGDDDYTYSVQVTDHEGVTHGPISYSFSCDTVMPGLKLGKISFAKPREAVTRVADGQLVAQFAWEATDASSVSFELWVDGEAVYGGSRSSCETLVADGEHHYELIAIDAHGNRASLTGSFVSDSALSGLELNPVALHKVAEGRSEATLSWSSHGADTYRLVVDGRAFEVEGTEFTLELPDGVHTYSVTMTDAAGDEVTAETQFISDATAPELGFNKPTMQQLGDGLVQVRLSWYCNEQATYTLFVNGETYELGQAVYDYTLSLPEGEYEYSLIATDASGNSITKQASFGIDLTPPELSLDEPVVVGKVQDGVARISFSWSSTKEATYSFLVNGNLLYRGVQPDGPQVWEVPDGVYELALYATDAVGNTVVVERRGYTVDATPPALTMPTLALEKVGDELTRVTFRWSGEAGATYELTVNGETAYSGPAVSFVLELADGTHSYSLKATDAAGNESVLTGADFTLHAGEPVLNLGRPQLTKAGEGRVSVTLSWACASGFHYTVVIDDEATPAYEGSGNSLTLELPDGEHSYRVIATDGGQHQLTEQGSFRFDASAPVLSLPAPTTEKRGEGLTAVLFSWAADEAASYELRVNGELAYSGPGTSYTLELEDGEHHYELTATDAAGNSSTADGGSFTLDATSPELSLAEPQTVRVGDGSTRVTWGWSSSEPGLVYELRVDGTLVYQGPESGYSVALGDGEHRYALTATDAAGNSCTVEGDALLLDATAPVPCLLAPTTEKSGEGLTAVNFSWTADGAASYELRVDGELAYSGPAMGTTLELRDGEHHYTLTATDAAGNSGTVEGDPLVLDATAPLLQFAEPLVEKRESELPLVTLRWASDGGDGTRYTLKVNGKPVYDGPATEYSLPLADGVHEYSLSATDAAGNTSAETSRSFTVNTTIPELRVEEPEIGARNKGKALVTFRWSLVAGGEGSRAVLRVDGRKVYSGTAGEYTLSLADNREHRYSLMLTDAQGKTYEWPETAFRFDASAPKLSANTWQAEALPDAPGQGRLTLSWKSSEPARFSITVDGETVLTDWQPEGGPVESGGKYAYSYTLDCQQDGRHDYSITATDAEGNSSTLTGRFDFDATPPQLTLQEPGIRAGKDGLAQVTLYWSGEKGTTYTFEVDGAAVLTARGTPLSTTASSIRLPQGYADGSLHSYRVIATDKSGNSSASGGSFAVDISAPETIFGVPQVSKSGEGQATALLSWASEPGATYELKVDGRRIALDDPTATSCSVNVKDGAHEYSIVATDSLGNKSEAVCGSFYIDATAPRLRLNKPQLSKAGEGEVTATLRWSGEDGVTYTVMLEGDETPAYVGCDKQCTITLPLGAEGRRYTVTATDAAGNSTCSDPEHSNALLAFDAVAPQLFSVEASVTQQSKGKSSVRFDWAGSDDTTATGLRYTLEIDGKKAYSGTAASCTVKLADGEHHYSLVATDKAGNSSVATGGSFCTDATAPGLSLGVPTISYAAGAEGTTFHWQGEAGVRYSIVLNGETLASGIEGGSYTHRGALADGQYTYSIIAEDAAAGIMNGALANRTEKKGSFRIDRAAAQVFGAVTPQDIKQKKASNGLVSVTLGWTAPKDAAGKNVKGLTYILRVDGEMVYTGTSTSRTLKLADGEHHYSIVAIDKAGNSSDSGDIDFTTLDATAPALDGLDVIVTHGATGTNASTAELVWKGEEGAVYTLKVGSVNEKNITIAANPVDGLCHVDAGTLKDGKHSYSITVAEDDKGTNKVTVKGSFVTDTKAPKLSLVKPAFSDAPEGRVDVTLAWKGEKEATYSLTVDGRSIELADPAATKLTLMGLKDGQHVYSVTARDAAGNESVVAGSFSYDSSAPGIILGALAGSVSTSKGTTRTKVTLRWAGEDGVSYTVKVDGKKVSVGKYTVNKQTLSTLSATTGALAAGVHTYSIVAKDKAGNVSEYTGHFASSPTGELSWVGAGALTPVPEAAQALRWDATDSEGFRSSASSTGAQHGYLFELTEARQLLVKLGNLSGDATLQLEQVGGQGSIRLSANAGADLDRELTLSAGTYYLQVSPSGTAGLGDYTLDLELEKNGKKAAFAQATLASLA